MANKTKPTRKITTEVLKPATDKKQTTIIETNESLVSTAYN